MRLIADIVGIVAKTDWSSSEKREIAVQMAEAALRKRGEEAKQHLIRLAVEASVAALKDSEEALADIGTAEEADIQAAEAEAEE